MSRIQVAIIVFTIQAVGLTCATDLWQHISSVDQLAELRGMSAEFDAAGADRVLKISLEGNTANLKTCWVSIPPPVQGWHLDLTKYIQMEVRNTGDKVVETTLWAVSANGWSAVGDGAKLQPGASVTLQADLRQTYPDGTPKIDPTQISEIRVMTQRAVSGSLETGKLAAVGSAEPWVRPAGHLDVPDMTREKAGAGKRVRYQLSRERDGEIYSALYLPLNWEPGKKYPVMVEFPGNIFYSAKSCWSTGRPEQCQMGYGITRGENAIWVSLPFVDRENHQIAESGFGSNSGRDTVLYTRETVEHICSHWGGDRQNLYLCGFSRGSIACGYIGLADDDIAKLWKAIIGCQHYDGSSWKQSRMDEAVLRAPRFRGEAIFQVDNQQEKYQTVVDATDPAVSWTWVRSGLGYHATAMFLDDRPAMKTLRQWYQKLLKN